MDQLTGDFEHKRSITRLVTEGWQFYYIPIRINEINRRLNFWFLRTVGQILG